MGSTSRTLSTAAFLLLSNAPGLASAAQPTTVPVDFAPIGFLLGTWSGGGTSDAGAGTGSDTFALEVQGRVVVRRSHAVYPPKDGKPGLTYESMMLVYKDPAYSQLRADYVDEGGHAIHYTLVAGTAPSVVQFVSDAAAGKPRFRLTYTDGSDDKTMSVKFEMAPPGSDSFPVTIAEGTDVRVATK